MVNIFECSFSIKTLSSSNNVNIRYIIQQVKKSWNTFCLWWKIRAENILLTCNNFLCYCHLVSVTDIRYQTTTWCWTCFVQLDVSQLNWSPYTVKHCHDFVTKIANTTDFSVYIQFWNSQGNLTFSRIVIQEMHVFWPSATLHKPLLVKRTENTLLKRS